MTAVRTTASTYAALSSTGAACRSHWSDLARNYGEHNAVMAGLRHASGAHVITMDDDLQNPPEEVERLLAFAQRQRKGGDLYLSTTISSTRSGATSAAALPTGSPISCSKNRGASISRAFAA